VKRNRRSKKKRQPFKAIRAVFAEIC